MILFPNAKINLGLRIKEKRQDGYHSIETILIPVALCDVLEFIEEGKRQTTLTLTGIELDTEIEDNLVIKAWKIMNRKFKIPAVSIHLHKVIPIGAGLGGGSADAAFMLKGLNEHFKCGCGIDELKVLAGELGSDCPFFITNTSSLGTGRGEKLEAIDIPIINYEILLVKPDIHIPTKEAYSGIVPMIPPESLKTLIQTPVEEWCNTIINDFETVVFNKYPVIRSIKNKLLELGAVYASMTGSGSAVYGIFKPGDIPIGLKEFSDYFTFRGTLVNEIT
jgi:4-diphosphocytidyl-2-C-methyl-D-erythritol kinase